MHPSSLSLPLLHHQSYSLLPECPPPLLPLPSLPLSISPSCFHIHSLPLATFPFPSLHLIDIIFRHLHPFLLTFPPLSYPLSTHLRIPHHFPITSNSPSHPLPLQTLHYSSLSLLPPLQLPPLHSRKVLYQCSINCSLPISRSIIHHCRVPVIPKCTTHHK